MTQFAPKVSVIGPTGMFVHKVTSCKADRMIAEGQAVAVGHGKRRPVHLIQLLPETDFGTLCRTRTGRKYTELQTLGNGYFCHRFKRIYSEDAHLFRLALTDCLVA